MSSSLMLKRKMNIRNPRKGSKIKKSELNSLIDQPVNQTGEPLNDVQRSQSRLWFVPKKSLIFVVFGVGILLLAFFSLHAKSNVWTFNNIDVDSVQQNVDPSMNEITLSPQNDDFKYLQNILTQICSKVQTSIEPDVPDLFRDLVKSLSLSTAPVHQQLWQKVRSSNFCPSSKIYDIFLDATALSGTNESSKVLINAYKQKQINQKLLNFSFGKLSLAKQPTVEAANRYLQFLQQQKQLTSVPKSLLLGITGFIGNLQQLPNTEFNQNVQAFVDTLFANIANAGDQWQSQQQTLPLVYALRNLVIFQVKQHTIPIQTKKIKKLLNHYKVPGHDSVRVAILQVLISAGVDDEPCSYLLTNIVLNSNESLEMKIEAYKAAIQFGVTLDQLKLLKKFTQQQESNSQEKHLANFIQSHQYNLHSTINPVMSECLFDPPSIEMFGLTHHQLMFKMFSNGVYFVGESDIIYDSNQNRPIVPQSIAFKLTLHSGNVVKQIAEVRLHQRNFETELVSFFSKLTLINDQSQLWSIQFFFKKIGEYFTQVIEPERSFLALFQVVLEETTVLCLDEHDIKFPIEEQTSIQQLVQLMKLMFQKDTLHDYASVIPFDTVIKFPPASDHLPIMPAELNISHQFVLGLKSQLAIDDFNKQIASITLFPSFVYQMKTTTQFKVPEANTFKDELQFNLAPQITLAMGNSEGIKLSVNVPQTKRYTVMKSKSTIFKVNEIEPTHDQLKGVQVCSNSTAELLGITFCKESFSFDNKIKFVEMFILKNDDFLKSFDLKLEIPFLTASDSTFTKSTSFLRQLTPLKILFDTPDSKINRKVLFEVIQPESTEHQDKQISFQLMSPWQKWHGKVAVDNTEFDRMLTTIKFSACNVNQLSLLNQKYCLIDGTERKSTSGTLTLDILISVKGLYRKAAEPGKQLIIVDIDSVYQLPFWTGEEWVKVSFNVEINRHKNKDVQLTINSAARLSQSPQKMFKFTQHLNYSDRNYLELGSLEANVANTFLFEVSPYKVNLTFTTNLKEGAFKFDCYVNDDKQFYEWAQLDINWSKRQFKFDIFNMTNNFHQIEFNFDGDSHFIPKKLIAIWAINRAVKFNITFNSCEDRQLLINITYKHKDIIYFKFEPKDQTWSANGRVWFFFVKTEKKYQKLIELNFQKNKFENYSGNIEVMETSITKHLKVILDTASKETESQLKFFITVLDMNEAKTIYNATLYTKMSEELNLPNFIEITIDSDVKKKVCTCIFEIRKEHQNHGKSFLSNSIILENLNSQPKEFKTSLFIKISDHIFKLFLNQYLYVGKSSPEYYAFESWLDFNFYSHGKGPTITRELHTARWKTPNESVLIQQLKSIPFFQTEIIIYNLTVNTTYDSKSGQRQSISALMTSNKFKRSPKIFKFKLLPSNEENFSGLPNMQAYFDIFYNESHILNVSLRDTKDATLNTSALSFFATTKNPIILDLKFDVNSTNSTTGVYWHSVNRFVRPISGFCSFNFSDDYAKDKTIWDANLKQTQDFWYRYNGSITKELYDNKSEISSAYFEKFTPLSLYDNETVVVVNARASQTCFIITIDGNTVFYVLLCSTSSKLFTVTIKEVIKVPPYRKEVFKSTINISDERSIIISGKIPNTRHTKMLLDLLYLPAEDITSEWAEEIKDKVDIVKDLLSEFGKDVSQSLPDNLVQTCQLFSRRLLSPKKGNTLLERHMDPLFKLWKFASGSTILQHYAVQQMLLSYSKSSFFNPFARIIGRIKTMVIQLSEGLEKEPRNDWKQFVEYLKLFSFPQNVKYTPNTTDNSFVINITRYH